MVISYEKADAAREKMFQGLAARASETPNFRRPTPSGGAPGSARRARACSRPTGWMA